MQIKINLLFDDLDLMINKTPLADNTDKLIHGQLKQ